MLSLGVQFRAIIALLCLGLPVLGTADAVTEIRFSVPRYTLKAQERDTVATVLILEAGAEGRAGMEAVMSVIDNRSKARPELYEIVVWRRGQFASLASSQGNPARFAKMLAIARSHPAWELALSIVDAAAKGELKDRTGGATYFHERSVRPYWTRSVRLNVVIGGHLFYVSRS